MQDYVVDGATFVTFLDSEKLDCLLPDEVGKTVPEIRLAFEKRTSPLPYFHYESRSFPW